MVVAKEISENYVIEPGREVKNPRTGPELTRDEAQQTADRVVAFCSILVEWSRAQTHRLQEIECRQGGKQPYMDKGVKILEPARDVQALVECKPAQEQRRFHNIVFSNCAREGGEVVSTLRQPSDLLVETSEVASRSEGDMDPSRKRDTWPGNKLAGGMERFSDEKCYRATDPAMRLIATEGTLAVWRCEGKGPAYIRFGNRVLYEGHALNRWLDEHRVQPAAA